MLTLLGATGYAGRLCAVEAARRRLPLRLAGRRREPLERFADDLGGAEVAVVDVTDDAAMTALAARSTVLLSTVGPYLQRGEPAVAASLAGGCHYLDIAGEARFVARVHERDDEARRAGVALCPAFGFDGVIGELLAGRAAAALGGPVTGARVAYLVRGGRLSAGSLRSALAVAAGGGAAWRDGRLAPEPLGAISWSVPFPSPLGRRASLSVPVPELVGVARSTGASTVEGFLCVPGAGAVPAVSGVMQAASQRLVGTPAWRGLVGGAARLRGGPSPGRRARARAAVLAEVVGPRGTRRAWAAVRDIYGTTAKVAVAAAARLLASGAPRAGALTPSQVVDADPLLDELAVRWEVH